MPSSSTSSHGSPPASVQASLEASVAPSTSEKPTTLAIQDLLDGKLDITYESEKEK